MDVDVVCHLSDNVFSKRSYHPSHTSFVDAVWNSRIGRINNLTRYFSIATFRNGFKFVFVR
jgi:hypothetical protein